MKNEKKLKLKKKNFVIFILIIFSIIYISIASIKVLSFKFDNSSNNSKEKKITVKEKKLKLLGNINKKIDYFNYDYIDRYLNYKDKNPNLSNKEVIINVNIGIDQDYYTNTKESPYLNKEYVLVNKYNYLPEDYIPDNLENIDIKYSRSGMQLVHEARLAFEKMAKDALNDNMTIISMSSYRSYQYQVNLYNKYVETDGKEQADTYSARPGYSEHQTGLATDVYNGKTSYTNFENTEEFVWMNNNAYKYGFILRFPKDKIDKTGYTYEAWHYRYVGYEIARYIHDNNISFEEYYVKFIENKM